MERSLLAFIELAVLELIPFSKFQSPTFRKHLNVEPVSVEVIEDTIIHLMFIVEEKIKKERGGKKGCSIHDGFSRYGTHYFGVIAQYVNYLKPDGKYEVVQHLLSAGPLGFFENEEEKNAQQEKWGAVVSQTQDNSSSSSTDDSDQDSMQSEGGEKEVFTFSFTDSLRYSSQSCLLTFACTCTTGQGVNPV